MSPLPRGPGALKEEKQVWSLLSPPPPSLVKNTLYRKQKGPVLVSPRGLSFPKHSANRGLSKLESIWSILQGKTQVLYFCQHP